MPLQITQRDIEEAHAYARDAMGRLKGAGRRDGVLSRTTTGAMKLGATAAGAALVGAVSGYHGSADLQIAGTTVPVDLLGGLVGKAASVFMEDGTASETLDAFSNGVLAAYVTKYMIGVGKTWNEKGLPGAKQAAAVSGSSLRMIEGGAAPSKPAPMSHAELQQMAAAIR